MKKYGFCHGWMLEPRGYTEVTCRQRENCRYYDVDFYGKHVHHLDEFEELTPFEPCTFFIPRNTMNRETTIETNKDAFSFL